jgi:hypothetical protein
MLTSLFADSTAVDQVEALAYKGIIRETTGALAADLRLLQTQVILLRPDLDSYVGIVHAEVLEVLFSQEIAREDYGPL